MRGVVAMFVVLGLGCAGAGKEEEDTGIPDDTLVSSLTDAEIEQICDEFVEETFECEDPDSPYTVEFSDCADSLADLAAEHCEATVGDWRACDHDWRAALRDNPCTQDIPDSCMELVQSCGAD